MLATVVGLWAALVGSVPPAVGLAASAGASPARTPALRRLLLGTRDVPTGWHTVAAPTTSVSTRLGCGARLADLGEGWHHRDATFVSGKGLPLVSEGLATGPTAARTWKGARRALSACRSATITINGTKDRATITPVRVRTAATGVVASRWSFEVTGLELGLDLVVFRVRHVLGSISYADVGTPDAANAQRFADAAVAKAGGKSGVVRGVVSVATAPVRTVRTSAGTVGYRAVGSGPPLVLVMGYGASMEAWDPQFVDALAHRFTVVIFDNAGIGKTAALRPPLRIDAMAKQTSALISALHLGSSDVLGWSMGGLVAEALAVRHPGQVRRLVLCAAYPGRGSVRPPQSAVDDLKAGGAKAQSVLFPPGHTADAAVVAAASGLYVTSSTTPSHVIEAQSGAILRAWAGKDVALRRFRTIRSPTLVADGADDRLVPPKNAKALTAGIARSTLVVYADAGHAFLFQELGRFVRAVESFLTSAAAS